MGSEAHSDEDEFKAAFDLTQLWGRDVWRSLLTEHGLTRQDGERFVWGGPTLTVETTCNPLNGHHYRLNNDGDEWVPADRLAYCGYIYLYGDKSAVRAAVEHIRQNSDYKEVSVGRYCV